MKKSLLILLCVIILLSSTGCREEKYADVPNPIATIAMRGGGVMRLELYVRSAPNTVANFVKLAQDGFFNGQEFYRIVPGGFIQAGDPAGDGTGGPGWTIAGEFTANGYENPLSHTRGAISMARVPGDDNYDTAGSQFFILHGSYPEYDGKYAVFGYIMDDESYKTLDFIAGSSVDGYFRPINAHIIDTITIDTKGYAYEPVIKEDERNE